MKPICAIAFAVVACGGTQTTTNASSADRLEEEFGGPSGLMEFFAGAPDAMISDVLDAHDIGVPSTSAADRLPSDVPRSRP